MSTQAKSTIQINEKYDEADQALEVGDFEEALKIIQELVELLETSSSNKTTIPKYH